MRDGTLSHAALAAVVGLAIAVSAPLADAGTADLVLENGHLYTVDPGQSTAEAMAIQDGTIVYVGDDAGAQAFVGPGTEVVDLHGRTVLPGLHDSHIHVLEAFHFGFTCPLPPNSSPESMIGLIRFCSFFQIGTDWVVGFGHTFFDMVLHVKNGGRPPVEILDEAVPNRPAVMMESTSHSVWANSLALEAAGFVGDVEDPPGGVIVRDPATGQPNGLLLDGAGEIAFDLAFAPNPVLEDMNYDALLRGLDAANRNGITSLADARVYWERGYVEAYDRAVQEGTLTARTILGLWAYPYKDDDEQIAELISMYENDPTALLRKSQVKIYSDGETGHTTAALLDPYSVRIRFAEPDGLNYFDAARMTRYVTELEAAGFDMHIHAIGDRGTHEALDAIESARSTNGPLGRRHRLTHLEVVAPDDVPRFSQLDVIADVQMAADFVLPPNLSYYDLFLGRPRREERVLRLRDLYDGGARVVLSSDYDVGDLSPFKGMERSLSRGDQSLPDVDAAIRAYTIEPAYLMRQESRVGSLEVGKLADLIVVDRDVTSIPISQIGETQVLWTVLGGEEVWRDPSF